MPPTPVDRVQRARPLPPAERRALLIASTIPLLSAHGRQITTRQIAEAAGVAEGTLFRVFADKDELIAASIEAACDPAPVLAELAAVDTALALRPRLTVAVTILQRWLVSIIQLMMAVRMHQPPGAPELRHKPTDKDPLYDAVVLLLQPDASLFRLPLREVARMVRLLTFSGSHPMIADGQLLTPEDIVDFLLDGACHPTPSA